MNQDNHSVIDLECTGLHRGYLKQRWVSAGIAGWQTKIVPDLDRVCQRLWSL